MEQASKSESQGKERVRIVLADDHDMVRQGLVSLIEASSDFEIVGTADSGTKALELVEKLLPDVVLLDIVMPDINGLQTATKIKANHPDIGIIMLSMEVSSEYIKTAFQNNIEGYIPKNADIKILIQAIENVAKGEKYYEQKVRDYIFKYFVGDEAITVPKIENLSDREVQVLKMIANGISNKDIAEQLFLSPKTVEAHRNNILKKLQLGSTADLVKFAIAKKITEIPKDMLK